MESHRGTNLIAPGAIVRRLAIPSSQKTKTAEISGGLILHSDFLLLHFLSSISAVTIWSIACIAIALGTW